MIALSAIHFILYLSRCLRTPIKSRMKNFIIKPKYADDLTYMGRSKQQIDEIEVQIPAKLRKYDLEINHTKTERYEIPQPNLPPPPNPSIETLIKHKDDEIIWSELDWISNYQPVIENKNRTEEIASF